MNASSDTLPSQKKLTRFPLHIFVIAVTINYVWEIAQAPLYVGMGSFKLVWWHCGLAALGDGLLLLVIYAVGWAVLCKKNWFVHPGMIGYVVMLLTGLIISVGIEWLAVYVTKRWEYTTQMPLVPLLNVGLIPVAQLLILPALIFRIEVAWLNHSSFPPKKQV